MADLDSTATPKSVSEAEIPSPKTTGITATSFSLRAHNLEMLFRVIQSVVSDHEEEAVEIAAAGAPGRSAQ